jgi:hypothetical protein
VRFVPVEVTMFLRVLAVVVFPPFALLRMGHPAMPTRLRIVNDARTCALLRSR